MKWHTPRPDYQIAKESKYQQFPHECPPRVRDVHARTRAAIENESLRAQAASQAQTIEAQGMADGERARQRVE